MKFKLKSKYKPAGDQPKAIKALVAGIKKGFKKQTLLGVTGSGKTFTAANVIQQIGKPTLVIAHNKTLAAQLAQEYRDFFPENEVHYFVSYYDYYQPEAYMPVTDTYIEKEAMINEEIERLRHASTQALLTRRDVIIVASVSCIYGLGSPEEYEKVNFKIEKGMKIGRNDLIRKLIQIYYERSTTDLKPGLFRAIGNSVELAPVSEKFTIKIDFDEKGIVSLKKINPVNRQVMEENFGPFFVFPAKHYITNKDQRDAAIKSIESELNERLKQLNADGKILEAERLKRRTRYDIAMLKEIGYTNGIENYSRHFSGKLPGDAPDTLLSYFPHKADGTADFLTIIDESHVTVPQIGGMYAGDASRKNVLVEHGFRLPSAKDNRPLKFEEFEERIDQCIYTSATPSVFERTKSEAVIEQVIRPTGLIDPVVVVKPVNVDGEYPGQVFDFIEEAKKVVEKGGRVLATTLTKKMAEELSEYLKEKKMRARYLHSEIKTLERIEIITDLRKGEYDILVGVNLLREGLDLPEVSLIGIFDADREGFLRSETSLIQIIGRAARNVDGRVILYADQMTGSLERAIKETDRRRNIQIAYNKEHGITPQTIIKNIKDITEELRTEHNEAVSELLAVDEEMFRKNPEKVIKEKQKQMLEAAHDLDFETAAILRDEITELEKMAKK